MADATTPTPAAPPAIPAVPGLTTAQVAYFLLELECCRVAGHLQGLADAANYAITIDIQLAARTPATTTTPGDPATTTTTDGTT